MNFHRNPIICLCAFFQDFSISTITFALIYMFRDRFAFDSGKIGTIMAVSSVFYVLSCNVYHILFNKKNNHHILIYTVSIYIAASITILINNALVVIVSLFVLRTISAFFWAPIMAWFAEGVNETQLNKDISWWSRSWMAGTLAGPMVSGVLYQRNALFPFLAASLCSVLTLICIVYLNKHFPLNPPKFSGNAPNIPGINSKADIDSLQQIQNRLSVYKISAWIGVCFANMFVGLIVNVMPIFIRDTLHYSARMAGLILLTRAFASIAGFTLLGRFNSWHFRKYFFIILQGLTVLCCLLFFLAGNNIGMYFVPAFFFGFLFAGFNGSSTFYSGIDKQNLRRNPALHEAFSAAGNSIGSLGGGFCFQYTGMGATFLIMMLAQGLGLLVLIFLSKKHR